MTQNSGMGIKALQLLMILFGIGVLFTAWILGYITNPIFYRGIVVFTAILIVFISQIKFKVLDKIWISIILTIITSGVSYLYLQFFWQIDLVGVVLPKNYIGQISLSYSDRSSNLSVHQVNKVLFLHFDASGNLKVNTPLRIPDHGFVVCEKINGEIKSQREFELIDMVVVKKADYSNLTGRVVRKK